MDRLAKGFRVVGGILLLANIITFFLPFLTVSQDGYDSDVVRVFDLAQGIMGYGNSQKILIAACVILPIILSVIMGIIGVVGGNRQWISGMCSVIICILYVVLFLNRGMLFPEKKNEQQVIEQGIAIYISLGISGVAAALGILGLIATPKKKKPVVGGSIPNIMEIKQAQMNENLDFVDEAQQAPAPSPPVGPRGVMVGVSGCYAGAEIPLNSGETIKLGREVDNDLIFEAQPKVSRNHCAITWLQDKGKYMITDTSTNGCFINGMDEDPIPKNIPIYLEVGTILDIGDENNRFSLE